MESDSDFLIGLKNGLCNGKDKCCFNVISHVYVIYLYGEDIEHSSSMLGEFRFSKNENTLMLRNLSIRPYKSEETIFKINSKNMIYDCKRKRMIVTNIGKVDENNGYITLIKLEDIYIKE